MFALSSAALLVIIWVCVGPAVRALLDPLFDQAFQARHAGVPLWQVKLSITVLYLASPILCAIAAILPLSVLGLLFPGTKPLRTAIVFAVLVAALLIGTRAKYMFAMPYFGALGGSVAVSVLAGVTLFASVVTASRLRAAFFR